MQNIIFRNIDGMVNVIANSNISYEAFIEELKSRLEKLYIKDDLLKSNVVLDIRNIELNPKRILNIFDILSNHGYIYISKIIYKVKNNKNIIMHEGNIRGGEIKLFPSNALIIGNINKGAKVIIHGNLYVIGKVNGYVEFKGISNKLMASHIEGAYVKICGIDKKIDDYRENVTIKVDSDLIVEESVSDRRENKYGKSSCSYIW